LANFLCIAGNKDLAKGVGFIFDEHQIRLISKISVPKY